MDDLIGGGRDVPPSPKQFAVLSSPARPETSNQVKLLYKHKFYSNYLRNAYKFLAKNERLMLILGLARLSKSYKSLEELILNT